MKFSEKSAASIVKFYLKDYKDDKDSSRLLSKCCTDFISPASYKNLFAKYVYAVVKQVRFDVRIQTRAFKRSNLWLLQHGQVVLTSNRPRVIHIHPVLLKAQSSGLSTHYMTRVTIYFWVKFRTFVKKISRTFQNFDDFLKKLYKMIIFFV